MAFDLRAIITERQGENYDLHHKYVNRTLAKVLGTIGFDKVYARAEGSYLYDMDGRDYLDFLSGYGVYNMGRNHPVVRKAIEDVLSLDLPNMVQMDCALLSGLLAEKVVEITPPHLDACFFANSGTEAVEGAFKFARAATGRTRILSLSGAYHGLSYGSLSATQNAQFQEGFGPFLPGVEKVAFNDVADLEAKLKQGDVAAFIAEPVQGKGVHIPDDHYFPAAQDLCRKYGALFIADEVQTGLGRTGKLFGFQHWDLEPDIVTMAKALSGGYVPCAAIVTTRKIYQGVFSRLDRCVVHSTTFGRNNLAMASGLASLEVLQSENLVENSRVMGEKLMDGLNNLKARHDLIKEVRGKGCMIAVEFQQPRSLKLKMAWKAIHKVNQELFAQMVVSSLMANHRILTHVAGHNMDVVKLLPPLIIGQQEVDRCVQAFDNVLSEVTKFPGPMWEFGTNLVKTAIGQKRQKQTAQA
ncbi:aspartate aminotransferase family protein [Ruficoccus sp. ZRK36]|uniref:aspartate aminotransferase family protein n=1 Tax=Ruficoccus sp. ZRK36 TaxID=2866311 RepID=UPI001C73637D|nr:aspartate aminotransferase family protein [Ruficoccus sp. ZRK36]QYY34434.1 aspartate aminotransferase family protein [Ruficoccus sp. ZRK36]